MKIDGELATMRQITDVCVRPGLQMGDVQGVTDGLDVCAQHRVRWTEYGVNTAPN
ncbi:unnamed protein product [Acanthoscelides obtectus]|uniref:Uncharacterized protein n=1 Tax=Acanthoscelides obtectus TaxID=200917 RepID=A0A9P0JNU0_ACAOB|nr:unnamed protein product [Acanthoscelides obtectus]CAK1673665.1 hypothetical protein AOBTE_LOCUS29410 [Acanthoscelides obtectus]